MGMSPLHVNDSEEMREQAFGYLILSALRVKERQHRPSSVLRGRNTRTECLLLLLITVLGSQCSCSLAIKNEAALNSAKTDATFLGLLSSEKLGQAMEVAETFSLRGNIDNGRQLKSHSKTKETETTLAPDIQEEVEEEPTVVSGAQGAGKWFHEDEKTAAPHSTSPHSTSSSHSKGTNSTHSSTHSTASSSSPASHNKMDKDSVTEAEPEGILEIPPGFEDEATEAPDPGEIDNWWKDDTAETEPTGGAEEEYDDPEEIELESEESKPVYKPPDNDGDDVDDDNVEEEESESEYSPPEDEEEQEPKPVYKPNDDNDDIEEEEESESEYKPPEDEASKESKPTYRPPEDEETEEEEETDDDDDEEPIETRPPYKPHDDEEPMSKPKYTPPAADPETTEEIEEMEAIEEELEEELLQEEREVRRIGGFGGFLAVLAMIFTAYQMSENPDGKETVSVTPLAGYLVASLYAIALGCLLTAYFFPGCVHSLTIFHLFVFIMFFLQVSMQGKTLLVDGVQLTEKQRCCSHLLI